MKSKIFAAAVLFISIASQGQDSTKTLNEIIVTANKYPNKTSLTGKVVTVITREQLEKSGGKDLSQVLTEQCGLSINGANSNAGKDKSVYLRGAKVDHTLIMVDGVPLYDPSGIGSNFDIRLLTIDNIERIEILKGSQSTLYGSDAMAGVINIITKKNNQSLSGMNGMLMMGSYKTFRSNISLQGNHKKYEYALNFSSLKSGGINETIDTISTPHQTDKDGYRQINLQESFTYKPSKQYKITSYVRYAKFNQDYDQDAFLDELDLSSSNTNLQYGIKNEFSFGKSNLTALYNHNFNQRIYLDDSVLSRNGFSKYSKGEYSGTEHFADLFYVNPIHERMKFCAGADFRSSNTNQSYLSISDYGDYASKLSKDSLHQNQIGLYGSFTANTKSGINLELGGRWNHHSAYGNNLVYSFNPSYFFKNRYKVYVNISSAYKTPTLYQLYSEYGNQQLSPEMASTFEVGTQFFSKNNKQNARITYFKRDIKNVILLMDFTKYINQDKQKDHGIELEGSISLGKKTALKVFYNYVDGKITTLNNGKDSSYFNLIRRPKNTVGINASCGITKKLFMNLGIQSIGKRTDVGYDYANSTSFKVMLKSYTICNLYAEYQLPKNKMKFFADIHNLTDTKFTEVYGFATMGINASFGLRFNY